MEELKSEIQNQQLNDVSQIPIPNPGKRRYSGAVVLIFLLLTVAISLVVWRQGWLKIRNTNFNKDTVSQNRESVFYISHPTGKLADLVIESGIQPIIHEAHTYPNGKSIYRWKYISGWDLDYLYNTLASFLTKRWSVSKQSQESSEQRIIYAEQNGSKATVIISKGDGQHAEVDITLVVPGRY